MESSSFTYVKEILDIHLGTNTCFQLGERERGKSFLHGLINMNRAQHVYLVACCREKKM